MLVGFFALLSRNTRSVINKDLDVTAYITDSNKLVVRNNIQKTNKMFKIPDVVELSIAPSGKKIAFWRYGKELIDPKQNKFEQFFGLLDFVQSPKNLNIFNIETGKSKKYRANNLGVGGKWSKDSRYFFVPSEQGVIYAINSEKVNLEFVIEPDYDHYSGVYFPEEDLYAAKFIYQDTDEMQEMLSILKKGKLVNELESVSEFSKIGDNLLVLRDENKLQILEPVNGKVIKTFNLPKEGNYLIDVSPSGKYIVINVSLQDQSGKPKACFDDGYYGDHVRIYDKNFKLIKRDYIQPIYFLDDKRFYYFKFAKKAYESEFFIQDIGGKKARSLGKFRVFDWLTDENMNSRIFDYPSNTRTVRTDKQKTD